MATTLTGRLLTPTNFGVPSPLDMAVQLGRIPRFVGATRVWPWTVLHHVMAAYLTLINTRQHWGAADLGPLSLMVLLHEADEVATGDIPTTWKTDDMRKRQHHLHDFVHQVYAPHVQLQKFEYLVKRLDWAMMAAEMELVGPPFVEEHSGMDAYRYVSDPSILVAAKEKVSYVVHTYNHPRDSMDVSGVLVEEFLRALRDSGANLAAFTNHD